MASTSETGHGRNVTNFETMITHLEAMGTTYNPSNPQLSITALKALATTAKAKVSSCAQAEGALNLKSDERRIAFAPLKSMGTKLIGAVKGAGVPAEMVDTVKTLNRKLQGARANNKKDAPPPTEGDGSKKDGYSVSQQSFDSQAKHLSDIASLLAQVPGYNPNETELKATSVASLATSLGLLNTNVTTKYIDYKNAKKDRDNVLYTEKTGLVDIALLVKEYVKSILGTKDPGYKALTALKFTRPRE